MRKESIFRLVSVTSALFALLLGGCGGGGGGGAGLPPGAVQMDAITTASPTGNIQAKIGGVTVGSSTVVTFALSDEGGQPLDPNVVTQNSSNRVRFFIAQLDATGNYSNYIGDASHLPTFDGSGSNPKGTFATVKPGVYTYTFGLDIKDTTKTLNGLAFDAAKTQTVAIQILRNTAKNGKSFQQMSDPYFSVVPAGGTPGHREVVAISNCNQCHGKLIAHGSRIEIALCILCHNPNANPLSTGQVIDFKAMIHKIHMGSKLPSKAYFMNPTFDNFSTVKYPFFSNDTLVSVTPIDCVKCHQAGFDTFGNVFGLDVDKWQEAPTRTNCTTCHNTTSFDGTTSGTVDGVAGVAMTLHPGGPQANDSGCLATGCHTLTGAPYSNSVTGAHAVFETVNASKTPVIRILNATNVGPRKSPTVTFQVTDGTGTPIVPSTATAAPFANSLQLKWAAKPFGMPDFANTTAGLDALPAGYSYGFPIPSDGQAASITVSGSATSVAAIGKLGTVDAARGIYFVNFSSASTTLKYVLPTLQGDYANGATIAFALQARRGDLTVTHNGVATTRNLGGQVFPAYYDLASGSLASNSEIRRKTVDTNACNGCHKNLVGPIHGGGRPNVEYCVMCHTPNLGVGTVAGDFKVFIHKFHRGVDLSDQTYNFNGVSGISIRYPNDLRRCNACHIAENPTVTMTTPTRVGNPLVQTLQPWNAVCTSCHDSTTGTIAGASGGAVGHASANPGTTASGDQVCINCHFDSIRALDHQLPN
jgi:OmcA/MtrC family decaheme c-type cytochrome